MDWHSVPGPPDWYNPDGVAAALRDLAAATSVNAASGPYGLLVDEGLVHDHSGAVFPAAAFAAPILLDIVADGHPVAQDHARQLLYYSMYNIPHRGYQRVDTDYAHGVPICCAVAYHVQARQELFAGDVGMVRESRKHWRFEVDEARADGDVTVAVGRLAGWFPDGVRRVELHARTDIVVVKAHVEDGDLRLLNVAPAAVPRGAVLFRAECGEAEH